LCNCQEIRGDMLLELLGSELKSSNQREPQSEDFDDGHSVDFGVEL